MVALKPTERHRADIGQTAPGRLELWPECEQGKDRQMAQPLDRQIEQLEGGGIRPVGVLEQDHDRSPARESLELIEQRGERPAALLRGADRQRRIAVAGRDRQQRGKKRYHLLPPRWLDPEERLDLVEALLGRIVGLEPCCSLQLRDDWTKRAVTVVGRTLIVQANGTLAGDAFSESRS